MSVTTPAEPRSFAQVKGHDKQNIFKALRAAVYVCPRDTTKPLEVIEEVWAGGGLIVPTRFKPFGIITKGDGVTWSRNVDGSEVDGHGYSRLRYDITKDVRGLQFTGIESQKTAIETYEGIDLSEATIKSEDGITGVIRYDAPPVPQLNDLEVLVIGIDGAGANMAGMVRWGPWGSITTYEDQKWTEGEEVRYPVKLDLEADEEAGTALRTWFFGPVQRLQRAGFELAGAGAVPAV